MHGPYGVSVRSGCLLLCALAVAAAADQVKVEGGVLEGITSADSAVRIFEGVPFRSEEHTSELQSLRHLVCRLLLEKKKPKRRARARCITPRGVAFGARPAMSA